LKLKGGESLFAAAKQMERHHPPAIGHFAAFQNPADANRELLSALWIIALNAAGPVGLSLHARAIGRLAMRANRAVRPAQFFQVLAGLISDRLATSKMVMAYFSLASVNMI
jgi:hypothetical protein